jgi:hypothetical protein
MGHLRTQAKLQYAECSTKHTKLQQPEFSFCTIQGNGVMNQKNSRICDAATKGQTAELDRKGNICGYSECFQATTQLGIENRKGFASYKTAEEIPNSLLHHGLP